MNFRLLILAPLVVSAPALFAQAGQPAPTPPPIVQASPRSASPLTPPGPQRVYAPSSDTLIAREAANGVLEGFRKVYVSDGAPRVVIYVNRALVTPTSAAKPGSETAGAANFGQADFGATNNPAATPTLADQQTVREIERLFGRAFRHAGAMLADQKTAAALLPEQAGARLTGDPAAKDREALAKVADVAIEVLISSRNLTVPEVGGDATYAVPDIQATAIRLKDSAIVGQAAASDVIGKGLPAGRIARQFSASDITEATALALMEDMLTGKK